MNRLYLAAEGDIDIGPDVIVISKKNAEKLGISENDIVIYEDIPGGISGQAYVTISAAISNDNVSVNQALYDKWGDNMSWFGTIEVRPKKEGEEVPTVQPPTQDLDIASQDIKSIIPEDEISKFEEEEKIPTSVSVEPEEDVDLGDLLDKLIDEDLGSDAPAPEFPVQEKPPAPPKIPTRVKTEEFGALPTSKEEISWVDTPTKPAPPMTTTTTPGPAPPLTPRPTSTVTAPAPPLSPTGMKPMASPPVPRTSP